MYVLATVQKRCGVYGLLQVQKFRHQQRQGEPKFERLKKLYEDAKQKQRTTETCRSIPDAERNRQAATDAAIEEQLHAQCSFRSQGTYLQGLVSQINASEQGNQKRCVTDADVMRPYHTFLLRLLYHAFYCYSVTLRLLYHASCFDCYITLSVSTKA